MVTWKLIPNTTDPVVAIQSISSQVPILFPGIILLVLVTITAAGSYAQQRREGKTNISMWLAISSLITTTATLILFLLGGFVGIEFVIIMIVLTLISAAFFLFNTSGNVDGI